MQDSGIMLQGYMVIRRFKFAKGQLSQALSKNTFEKSKDIIFIPENVIVKNQDDQQ